MREEPNEGFPSSKSVSLASEMVHRLCFHNVYFKTEFNFSSRIRSYLFLATCQAKQSREKKDLGEAELGVFQLINNEKNSILSTF